MFITSERLSAIAMQGSSPREEIKMLRFQKQALSRAALGETSLCFLKTQMSPEFKELLLVNGFSLKNDEDGDWIISWR
jgi:hypothetical protein